MMIEQPPSSTVRELSEYLSRQFDKLSTSVNTLINKPVFTIPDPLTVNNLFVTVLATIADLTVTGLASLQRLILSSSWNSADNQGQIFLNGATGNRIDFNRNGYSPPSVVTRSAGTKIVLFPTLDATITDYALGIDANTLWNSVANNSSSFKWYGGTAQVAYLSGIGDFLAVGGITSSNPTKGVGYGPGAGGSVTQLTSKSTAVTLNAMCGQIATHNAALAAGATVQFSFNCTGLLDNESFISLYEITQSSNYSIGWSYNTGGARYIWIKNNTAASRSDTLFIYYMISRVSLV